MPSIPHSTQRQSAPTDGDPQHPSTPSAAPRRRPFSGSNETLPGQGGDTAVPEAQGMHTAPRHGARHPGVGKNQKWEARRASDVESRARRKRSARRQGRTTRTRSGAEGHGPQQAREHISGRTSGKARGPKGVDKGRKWQHGMGGKGRRGMHQGEAALCTQPTARSHVRSVHPSAYLC